MYNYAWIIPDDVIKSGWLGEKGISPNYIVPFEKMNKKESELVGSNVWLIARRGNEDRCIGVIYVKKVEQFTEGLYEKDYILTVSIGSSLRMCYSYDAGPQYVVSDLPDGNGITNIQTVAIEKIVNALSTSLEYKFVAPSNSTLRGLNAYNNDNRSPISYDDAIRIVVQEFTLDKIWGSRDKVSPYAFFAQQLMRIHGSQNINFDASCDYQKNDPVYKLITNYRTNTSKTIDADKTQAVDIEFTEIDPANIRSRRFISGLNSEIDYQGMLNKTELSEAQHQEMLRDIAGYFKEKSITPFESMSIDLMVNHSGLTYIYEIKSANCANIIQQASKAAFQIAIYTNAIKPISKHMNSAVILHKIENDKLEEFVISALGVLGVKCLIYNPKINWPHRVDGLLDAIIDYECGNIS